MLDLILYLALMSTPTPPIYSTTSCQPPVWSPVTHDASKVYVFQVKKLCTVSELSGTDYVALRDFLISDLKASAQADNGSTDIPGGVAMDLTHALHTEHGDMTIRADVTVTASEASCEAKAVSKSIEATGNAKYTQAADMDVLVVPSSNKRESNAIGEAVLVTITKEVLIKKPGIAPEGLFIRKAQEGIEDELESSAQDYTAKIAAHL